MHGDKLLYARIGNTRTFEGEGKGAMPFAKIARVQQRPDSGPIDVSPVKAAVQNVEAEVAVYHQIIVGRQIGGKAKGGRCLFPRSHGGVRAGELE